MKRQTLILLTIIAVIGLLISIYFMLSPLFTKVPGPIVGGDKDIHGCIPSAGFSWCEAKQKCLRTWEENCTAESSACDYNSTIKSYIKKDPNCVINFLCIQGTKAFSDECGCGCEKINSEPEKIYCTPEQKKAEVCPEYYSATCGWFNQSIKCLKYPCAQTFSNPCFACAQANVEYYTEGVCPK
jgi:hypothetical protein